MKGLKRHDLTLFNNRQKTKLNHVMRRVYQLGHTLKYIWGDCFLQLGSSANFSKQANYLWHVKQLL